MSDDVVLDPVALQRLKRLGGPPFLRQMVELYLQHGPDRIRAMEEGVSTSDAAKVERAAHSLKSSAGNLGATRLQEAALALELAGAAGTVDIAAAARVREEYTAAEKVLRALLEEAVE